MNRKWSGVRVARIWVWAAVAVLLVACGQASGTAEEGEGSPAREGAATLAPIGDSEVSGAATLDWDLETQVLAVNIELTGLEEGASYSSQITPGCGRGTGHIYKLDNLVGGPDGTAQATMEISDVEAIDVSGGWSVKVGRPPGGSPGGGPQACGEVGPS